MRSATWKCLACGNLAKGVDAPPDWCDECSVGFDDPQPGNWQMAGGRSGVETEREDTILAFADRMVAMMGVDPHDVTQWGDAKRSVLTDLRATLTHLRVLDSKS